VSKRIQKPGREHGHTDHGQQATAQQDARCDFFVAFDEYEPQCRLRLGHACAFRTVMVKTVDGHYADLLGPVYTWMVGDVDAALSRSVAELDSLPLPSKAGGTAVDLGAGFGLHSLPLARRGFRVVAIDSYDPLLQELESRKGSLTIRTVNADLLAFRTHVAAPIDVIMCMGDTLTHLPNQSSVESLFGDVAASLAPGGLFVATFRDYVSAPLQGDARFILVRGDEERVLTCFLEYADTTVTVHDLLHQREGGSWQLRASSYSKLRLSPEWVVEQLSSLGLSVRRDAVPGGMIRITARMPGSAGAAKADKGRSEAA
jgi:2-polyprenyl-3-methyl-5-hydroxy-6-metoxy-1,4-benzoquinol methylase